MKRRTILRTVIGIPLYFFAVLLVPAACAVDWTSTPDPSTASEAVDASSAGQTSTITTTVDTDDDDDAAAADASDVDAGNPCDVDGDGYYDLTKPECADAGGTTDCDDSDPRTHPNQDFLADTPVAPRLGDWNCANGVEKLYPKTVKCEGFSAGCNGVGFETAVECGAKGSFVKCAVQGIYCTVGTRTMNTQTCR